MAKHYFSLLLRRLTHNKTYTIINVAGLALALACCMVLALFVLSESRYDDYHENRENIYRLTLEVEQLNDGGTYDSALTSFLWAPALIADYPEIRDFIRIFHISDNRKFSFNETEFQDERFVYADENLFNFFTWPLLQGDPATVLGQPYAVVVSESIAQSYFGDTDPIGQVLTTYEPRLESASNPRGILQLTVTGVMADVPYQSHVKPSMVASFSTLNDVFNADVTAGVAPAADFWRARNAHTYLQLNPQSPVEDLEARFPDFLEKYVGDSTTSRGFDYRPYLQGIDSIHLEGPVIDTFDEGGDREQLYMFGLIAIAILTIACINFMNLATVQSITRACEIGVRKVAGARCRDLVVQFLGESIFLSTLALVLAFAMAELLNPIFYAYIGREFYLPTEDWPLILVGLCSIAVLVGALSGAYPAFVMANVKAVDALQTRFAISGKGRYFSKALVTMQFAITIFFVAATIVVFQQRHFMVTHDLGIKTDRIVIFPIFEPDALGQIDSIRNELSSFAGIQGVTVSNGVPGAGRSGDIWGVPGSSDQDVISMEQVVVDYDYVGLYGLEIVAGRNFDRTRTMDAAPLEVSGPGYEMSAIVNETVVRSLGFSNPEEVIGKRLVRDPVSNDFTVTVIGVVRDFHQVGLQNEIGPTVFYIDHHQDPGFRLVSVELMPENISGSIEHIHEVMGTFLTDRALEYYFVDQYFQNRWYQGEQRLLEIFSYITALTIFVACMGLLGLATFSAEQRTKEIGIRKVMGGSVWSIVLLLTNDFSKLVLLANLIAWPVAYFAMERWLQNFAYRIDLAPLVFVGSGLIALCIAWVTVGGTAAKAASAKPVLALRYE